MQVRVSSATRAVRRGLPELHPGAKADGRVIVWKWHSDLAAKTSTSSFGTQHSRQHSTNLASRSLLLGTAHKYLAPNFFEMPLLRELSSLCWWSCGGEASTRNTIIHRYFYYYVSYIYIKQWTKDKQSIL